MPSSEFTMKHSASNPDRKSTRLNSSHVRNSYAVFCLKNKPITQRDFSALFALFHNIDDSGHTTVLTPAMPVPTLLLPDNPTHSHLPHLRRLLPATHAH